MKHPYLKVEFQDNKKSRSKSTTVKIGRLFAQNKHSEILQKHELELLGISDMVNGLEYHHKKFIQLETTKRKYLQKTWDEKILYSTPNNAIHEAIAYLNRMGQIYALFTSGWFENYIKKNELADLCPHILALTPLRNKHAAHRSIDKPMNENDFHKAMSASIPFVVKWLGKASENPLDRNFDTYNIGYSMQISKNEKNGRLNILKDHHPDAVDGIEHFSIETIFITFIPAKHHEKILNEIFNIIKKLFDKKP